MRRVVILGTGGTIAGKSADMAKAWQYQSAQLSVAQLVADVPALSDEALEVQQVAQIDSKDMSWPVWRALGHAVQAALQRDDVAAVVITHGTDTLEETAYLLHRLLDQTKPVVLTAAMRPANAADADGPRNLSDAVAVARAASEHGLSGVVVVMGGKVWPGAQVRKAHSSQIDAFDGGGALPLQCLDAAGSWRQAMPAWPQPGYAGWKVLAADCPRVEVVTCHADADGWVVDAMLGHAKAQGPLRGLVVATTGHGTVHHGMDAALRRAEKAGVVVWLSSRVARGGVTPRDGDVWPAAGALTVAQARVALVLSILMG